MGLSRLHQWPTVCFLEEGGRLGIFETAFDCVTNLLGKACTLPMYLTKPSPNPAPGSGWAEGLSRGCTVSLEEPAPGE